MSYRFWMWPLFVVICVYQALDVYQTKMLFDFGFYEANPLVSFLIDVTGTWTIIVVVKLTGLTMLGLGINNVVTRDMGSDEK